MSFILDALRKSEHERQRSTVPGISNVPFATPRRETPRWMLGVIAALALAVLALGGAWWRSSRVADAPAAVAMPLEVPPPAAPAPPPETRSARVEPPSVAAEPPAASVADDAPAPPEGSVRAAERGATLAVEPDDGRPTLPSATALTAQGITVPALRLELHAYSERAAERFVFINGKKYVEGDTVAEGPRLVAIERDGAVMSYLGRRFLLARE